MNQGKPREAFGGLPRELRDMIWRELLVFKNHRFRKVDAVEVVPLHQNTISLDDYPVDIDRNRLQGMSGRVVDLRLLFVNRQVFLEASSVFYSSNEFIISHEDFAALSKSRMVKMGGVRPGMAFLRLEGRHGFAIPRSDLYNVGRSLDHFSNLHTVTIAMPLEPPATVSRWRGHISLDAAAQLVLHLSLGRFKRLRLHYQPISSQVEDPRRRSTIQMLLRLSSTISLSIFDLGVRFADQTPYSLASMAWNFSHLDEYQEVMILLENAGFKNGPENVVVRYETASDVETSDQDVVVAMTRCEDEPVKRETVDRPVPKLVSQNSQKNVKLGSMSNTPSSKRKYDHVSLKTTAQLPTKIPRLGFPQPIVFTQSRKLKMERDDHERRLQCLLDDLAFLFNSMSI